MTRKRDPLSALWQAFVNQNPPPSEATMKYVAALRARIDVLELEKALSDQQVRLLTSLPKAPS